VLINPTSTYDRVEELAKSFRLNKPFGFLVIDQFLNEDAIERIVREWPKHNDGWLDSNGLNQRKKLTQPIVSGTVAEQYFTEINSPRFLKFLETVSGIQSLLADPTQFGGGYHETFEGGYLNVHIDFNKHEQDKTLHRRLNLITYFNEGWKEEYGGALELWDIKNRRCLAKELPILNRCVVFETNEISFHGHPEPVKLRGGSRKSLAAYYYTKADQSLSEIEFHNTIYRNTTGIVGFFRSLETGVKHAYRRMFLK
jgi:hypothetical protein